MLCCAVLCCAVLPRSFPLGVSGVTMSGTYCCVFLMESLRCKSGCAACRRTPGCTVSCSRHGDKLLSLQAHPRLYFELQQNGPLVERLLAKFAALAAEDATFSHTHTTAQVRFSTALYLLSFPPSFVEACVTCLQGSVSAVLHKAECWCFVVTSLRCKNASGHSGRRCVLHHGRGCHLHSPSRPSRSRGRVSAVTHRRVCRAGGHLAGQAGRDTESLL